MIELRRCDEWFIRPVIEADHYLHRWPDPRSLPFGYALLLDGACLAEDGRPFGALVFKKLQHLKQEGLFGYPGLPTDWQVLDLARVWVHPSLQAGRWWGTNRKGELALMKDNWFSRMVAMAMRVVQRDWILHHPPPYPELPYHIELIVSYCDRAHHHGTGYRAAGFKYFGQTADETKDIYTRQLRRPRWAYESPQPKLLEVALAGGNR